MTSARFGCEEAFEEALPEQNLHHLLDDGQQPTVVDPNALLQQWQHGLDLRELLVVVVQRVDGVLENLLHQGGLFLTVEVHFAQLQGVRLALSLAELEYDDGVVLACLCGGLESWRVRGVCWGDRVEMLLYAAAYS